MVYFIILLLILIFIDFIFQAVSFYIKYAKKPLEIKTFDGYNQPYHPSVLFFSNGWNGYNYWMALTPYPMNGKPYKDRWECPCIYSSENGKEWVVPGNLINPLDDLSDKEIENKDFFSDPHLVYVNDRIECWYRISHHSGNGGDMDTFIVRKVSYDGIDWCNREVMIDPLQEDIKNNLGDMVRSPAIIYHGKYYMWYVDNKKNVGQRNICYTVSEDGKNWIKSQKCILYGHDINPWHIDVNYIDNFYWLTVYDLNSITLWKSVDGLNFEFLKILLSPSLKYGSFYSDGLYRSVLIKDDKDYRLYFSAFDDQKTSIGLMQGKTPMHMKIQNIKNNKIYSLRNVILVYLFNRKRDLSVLKSRILSRNFL